MSLKIGTAAINKTYLGSTETKKMYLGTTLIYDKVTVTPVTLSYLGGQTVANDGGTTSFTASTFNGGGNSLGTTNANRQIIVAVHWIAPTASVAPTGVTCNGSAMTQVTSTALAAGNIGTRLYKITNNSASGNIVVSFGSNAQRVRVDVWNLIDANATVYATATPDTTLSGEVLSTTVSAVNGGCVIAACFGRVSSGSPSFTWTSPTENSDYNMTGIYAAYGGTTASIVNVSTGTYTVENTQTGASSASSSQGLIAISFQPI